MGPLRFRKGELKVTSIDLSIGKCDIFNWKGHIKVL